MLYRTLEIDELIDSKANLDREIIDLMENNGSHLKLVSLKKHQILEPHMSHSNTTLFLVDGEIEIIFADSDNCTCQSCGCDVPIIEEDGGRKYKIKKGQLFMFEKDVLHTVKALKDSNFLLVKI